MKRETFILTAPCHFGLEAILKREIIDLGYEITSVDNGKVSFEADEEGIAYANVFLRTAERVLINIAEFTATTYDELFENVKKVEWSRYLPYDARFNVVKVATVNSQLFSPSDIQRIIKKAIVDKLKFTYPTTHFPETGANYPLRVSLMKNKVSLYLDTSGVSLHKRGYRRLGAKAPISETLAAALISLSVWNKDRLLLDPFCGSGTIPIEAAMLAANIAPGMNRGFAFTAWDNLVSRVALKNAREEASDNIKRDIKPDIQGYDIDAEAIGSAIQNAKMAGVDDMIHLQRRALKDLSSPKRYGVIITNPPYGERLLEKNEVISLYRDIRLKFADLRDFSYYIITSFEDAEKYLGKATKNRKIYNGMIKSYYYMYLGERPPKKIVADDEKGTL